MRNAYVIFVFNPDYDARPGSYASAYTKLGVWRGNTAREALLRFAAVKGLAIIDGPGVGGYWLHGRKRLSSFGRGQYHADLTTLPANLDVAR
jgi:hypothetical protein